MLSFSAHDPVFLVFHIRGFWCFSISLGGPSTTCTSCPCARRAPVIRSIDPISLGARQKLLQQFRRNACGVLRSTTRSRGIVRYQRYVLRQAGRFYSLTVSIAGIPRIAAAPRASSITRRICSGVTKAARRRAPARFPCRSPPRAAAEPRFLPRIAALHERVLAAEFFRAIRSFRRAHFIRPRPTMMSVPAGRPRAPSDSGSRSAFHPALKTAWRFPPMCVHTGGGKNGTIRSCLELIPPRRFKGGLETSECTLSGA